MKINSKELSDGIVKANILYRSGNYQEALSIYEQVASRHGWANLIQANVALCRKRLGLPLKLSVVVPVFNTAKYLEKCLWSILNQTEVSLEVIVINDGSSDNSLDIIHKIMKRDKRIVLVHNNHPSGNPGTPRNQGISIAKGEYLGFVDSDDWIEHDYFSRLIEAIESNNRDIAFASGYTNHIDDDKSEIVTYDGRHFSTLGSELYCYHESFMIWDKIYRTDLIKSLSIKFGETKAAVDVPFIFKVYYLLRKAGFADTKGYHYRRESDSSVTVKFRKLSNCDFEIQAYRDVELWSRNIKVTPQYNNIIKYKKVTSYIYTLRIISSDEFYNFFNKIKPELQDIDRDIIARISDKLKKPLVLKKFTAIVSGDAESYFRTYRVDNSKTNIAKISSIDKSTFEIEGSKKGVLFFPDWSRSNPYQKLFYASLAQNFDIKVKGYPSDFICKELLDENREDFSYLHLHWLHSLMDLSREDGADNIISILKYAKNLGYKIIYTAHNILSHDSMFRERELEFRKKIAIYFDFVLVHGEIAKQRIIDEIKVDRNKIHIMPHGTYQGYYPNYVTREGARQKLGIDKNKFLFLFFGNIKKYKGVNALLDKYKIIRSKRKDVALVIAGRIFDSEIELKINDHVSKDPSILFNPGFIEEYDIQYYFNAADLVILPYTSILTSGAALLSFAFQKPILAPRSGVISSLIEDGKQGYLFDSYDGMLTLMEKAVEQQRKDGRAWAEGFNFSALNAGLRWPLLTAHPAFSRIFGQKPRTEDYTEKRSRYRYALIRILGNDLSLRHSQDQTYMNLKFILENETEFEDCLKLWILNRIIDTATKRKLVDLLSKYGKQYIDIPYKAEVFAQAGYCFEDLPKSTYKLTQEFTMLDERKKVIVDNVILKHKNNYIINNNGARNHALREGAQHADWVFPWDGNCFVTDQAWVSITKSLRQRSDLQYHIVPMERIPDNNNLLQFNYTPNPSSEPQIIFRKDAKLRFNEELMYGFRPKVELLKRLGVPGVWDKSNRIYPWSRARKTKHGTPAYNYSWAGWCSRLFSGKSELEVNTFQRAINRERAIVNHICFHEKSWYYRKYNRDNLVFYDEDLLKQIRAKRESFGRPPYAKTLAAIKDIAQKCLGKPLYSVIDKTTLPPSGTKQDYWHPAPYSWPNPASPDGLSYIYRDGERVPGTRMYEPQSIKYDRTAMQRVFDETTALALAGYIFSAPEYTEKAAKLIRHWFIEKKTAMNPHLTYSQVIMGRNENRGTASGLIETKDMYYFLDAVRLVRKSTFWNENDEQKMLTWCKNFLAWLNTSEQGQQEVSSVNNHGVAFDLQTYALAAFIGDIDEMYTILLRSLSRMKEHVDKNGVQQHEMVRTTTAHYTAFNLHLWLNLSVLLRRTATFNLFDEERDYDGIKLNPLKKAISWVLSRADCDWPFKQIDEFDKDRYQHIYHMAKIYSPSIKEKYHEIINSFSESKVVFFPHDGIAPFWTLHG